MTTKVVTNEVRFSYANLMRPRVNQMNGKEEYSTQILIPKSDKDGVAAIKAAAKAALQAKWGDKVPAKVRNPLRDGDTETKSDGSPLGTEYSGHFFMTVKTSADRKPGVVDAKGRDLIDADAIVSGDYGRVSLNAYAYDAAGNKGVAFGLNHVMLGRKGDQLGGGRSSAASDFGLSPATAAATVASDSSEDDDAW